MSEKIAGVCAMLAFILVLMIGIYFQQPTDEIVMKSLVAMVLFYILGFLFGEAGSLVVLERMERFDLKKWLDTEGRQMGIHMEGTKMVADTGKPETPPAPKPAVPKT